METLIKGKIYYIESMKITWLIKFDKIDDHQGSPCIFYEGDYCLSILGKHLYKGGGNQAWGNMTEEDYIRDATQEEIDYIETCIAAGFYLAKKQASECIKQLYQIY